MPNGMYQMSDVKKNRILSAGGKRVLRKKSAKKGKKKMMIISNSNFPLGFKAGSALSPYL